MTDTHSPTPDPSTGAIHGGPYQGYQEPASGHGEHGHGDHGHDGHSHGGIAKYIYVFIALCVLTAMSFWTYADFPVTWPFHDSPAVGRAFMLAVSCTKAMLVIMFFMHVAYEANWKYVLTIPAAMMSVFLMLMLVPDVGLRMRRASEERKQRMAQPVAETKHGHDFNVPAESPAAQP